MRKASPAGKYLWKPHVIHSCAGFTSSAGIAANKLLAKISSALNKPNQQTIVPPRYLSLQCMTSASSQRCADQLCEDCKCQYVCEAVDGCCFHFCCGAMLQVLPIMKIHAIHLQGR